MSWLYNLCSIAAGKSAGICPNCGSSNTDYAIMTETGQKEGLGHGDIWCYDCLSAYHLSRVFVDSSINREVTIPKSLRY